jgi:hypothetical protein
VITVAKISTLPIQIASYLLSPDCVQWHNHPLISLHLQVASTWFLSTKTHTDLISPHHVAILWPSQDTPQPHV